MQSSSSVNSCRFSHTNLLAVPLFAAFGILFIASAVIGKPSEHRDDHDAWTLERWIAWRDRQIEYILEPTFESHGEKLLSKEEVISRCSRAYNFIRPCLDKEPGFFSKDAARAKALGNFVDFITAQHWMDLKDSAGNNTHALGLEISDRDYWQYASADAELPELLRSQSFLKTLSNPATYRLAVSMIENHNENLSDDRKWIVLLFRARFIRSVDRTTYGRMLVLVPNEPTPNGGAADKWVQFAIATPDLDPVPVVRSVSIVTVHRELNDPTSTKTYLVDFMRLTDPATGDIVLTPTMLLPHNPSKNCYDCHKSAVIPIHPEAEFAFDESGMMVERTSGAGDIPDLVNQRIAAYGPPNFGVLKPDAYGPCLGPLNRGRSDQFIKDATQGMSLAPASYTRIRESMKCAMCHDQFARINYLQAVRSNQRAEVSEGKRGIVQTFIEQGWMPPGNTLSDIERKALWRCLLKEYYDSGSRTGLLVEWLKGDSSIDH